MFQFTRKPSSGSHSQYLAKIAQLVQSGYIEFIQDIMTVMLEQLPYFKMFSLSLSPMAPHPGVGLGLLQEFPPSFLV